MISALAERAVAFAGKRIAYLTRSASRPLVDPRHGEGGIGAEVDAKDLALIAAPRVIWSPRGNRAQLRLMTSPVFEIFFGGARGGGKTDGVLGEFGAHASRYGKDAIGLMVRRTRAELVETIERSRAIYGPLK